MRSWLKWHSFVTKAVRRWLGSVANRPHSDVQDATNFHLAATAAAVVG
jgi:hypothetical protein